MISIVVLVLVLAGPAIDIVRCMYLNSPNAELTACGCDSLKPQF